MQSPTPGSSTRTGAASLVPVGLFTGCYLLAAGGLARVRDNHEFFFYIGVVIVFVGIVACVHRTVGLSGAVLWCLSIWGLAHMAGGLVPVPEDWPINGTTRVLYSLWLIPERLKYDHIVHAYGFGVATWVCWQSLRGALERQGVTARPTPGMMLLVAAAGMGFGALNEVLEFAATLWLPQTNVGGYMNTGWDMVANTVGTTTAALLIWWCGRGANPSD